MNQSIRIGTLVEGLTAVNILPQILPHGFESIGLAFWKTTGFIDLVENAKQVWDILDQHLLVRSISIYLEMH